MIKLNEVEILTFTKHLAVMIKAGIPLAAALANLEQEEAGGNVRKMLKNVLTGVQAGERLKDALGEASASFGEVYLALVGIGEQSGTLQETLDYLAKQLTKVYALRRKVKGAMLYPSLVLGLMAVVGMGLALFVLPKLTDFFAAFETKLPLSTTMLLWFAQLMKNYGWAVVGGLVGGWIVLKLILNSPLIKPWWHRFQLKIPYLGNFNRVSKSAEFLRNLGILLASGVPITQTWEIVIASTTNEYLRQELRKVGENIQKGEMVGESMEKTGMWAIPVMAQRMLAVGERTGKVDEMALYMADYYEEEIDVASKNLTTIIEPALLLIVGLLVAFLALAIISPIYQITGSIGG